MSTPVKYLIQAKYSDNSTFAYKTYFYDSFENAWKKAEELNGIGNDEHSIPCTFSVVTVTPVGNECFNPVEPLDNVNHPKHYNTIEGIECLDVAENFNFNLGNAIKYIWRSSFKGKQLEDLKKAAFYVNREIERLKHETKN
jgi:hypothetical protein